MKRYTEVTLIGEELTKDENFEQQRTTEEQTVIGTLSSVSAAEFYAAANTGYLPEIVVKIYEQEYAGQKRVRVNGIQYTVIRTYLSGDFMELHCQRKGADENG